MRCALVIPTRNAAKRGQWQALLDAVAAQSVPLECKLIIDTASEDATCAMAKAYNWECRTIGETEFNHGKTRSQAVFELAERGMDTVIFLSQDAVPADADAFLKLTEFLWNNPVSGCYGKQISRDVRSFDAWQRRCCYSEESAVRTLGDVSRLGLRTVFFSNAFSAWKISDVLGCGGFPETDFGEDMLFAAKILQQGGAVGYCAEAVVLHDHSGGLCEFFCRGGQVGAFHRKHPELLRQFAGGHGVSLLSMPPFRHWGVFCIKAAGYIAGRYLGKDF